MPKEGFKKYRKPTRREQFLEEMDRSIPWAELSAVIEPFYPKGEGPGREPAPDETAICKFRHLLERHNLGDRLFALIAECLQENGLKVSADTIVDATIISAPSSTKNRDGKRDPEMWQTKKGNQWYFSKKAHIGVDSRSKLIHSVAATAANVHDSQLLPDLRHGGETRVWGDSAYTGQGEVIRAYAPKAKDFTQK